MAKQDPVKLLQAQLNRLKPTISHLSTKTDTFLQHTSRLLTTSNGIDNTLGTLLFTATLLHSQLTRLLAKRYERLALSLVSKTSNSTLPGETVLATLSPPPSSLQRTCASLKALSNTSADVWMALRMFGLFHIYRWFREAYTTPHRDAVVKTLLYAQIAAAASFQVLENFAFLASKGILQGEKWERRWPRWMAFSNRFWMAQIVLEGLRLLRVRQLGWDEELGAEKMEVETEQKTEVRKEGAEGMEKDGKEGEVSVQSAALEKRWKRDFYANAGWLPLTLHWSYVDESESPISEVWQGLCGLVPCVHGLWDAWGATA